MGFEGFPFILGWELTLICNLRCRHCGSSAGLSRDQELSTAEAIKICDQLPALLVQEVNFTGGEPLLRPDWPVIAAYLGQLDIKTKFLTNGIVLDHKIIHQMLELGVAGVGISLDGLAETHDFIRCRNGLFSEVLSKMKLVLEAEIPLTVITTANSKNIGELPALAELLADLGVTRWQIQPTFPLGRVKEFSYLRLSEDDYLRLGSFAVEWRAKSAETGLEILPGDSFGYFTELDDREPPWRGCPAGLFSCGITSDGKIKGCLSLPDEIIEGDLRKNDLWEIWFHPDSFAYTRQFNLNQLGANCESCSVAELCKGGCSAMSYGSTKQFHNDSYCFTGIRNRCPTPCPAGK